VTWDPELHELRRRTELAAAMGGEEKVARQHDAGKLTVRERIDALVDPSTFHEVGALTGRAEYDDGKLAGFTPANFVMGRARIEGRPVVVGGDDFTVRGGAADASIFQKQVHAEQMANELRLPIVRLVDGSGGGGSVKSIETMARSFVPFNPGWEWVVENLATVPVVALCLGSVAGLGAARVVTSHYSVMVRGTSQLFVAGPPVVARLGEHVDKEELGGSDIQGRNGAVDDVVDTEHDAFARARAFLSYLPRSVDDAPPREDPTDDPERRERWLVDAIPRDARQVYKVRDIIDAVVDRGSFLEIGRGYGRSAVTGLARLDGWPVAVLAGDPYFYGAGWTADASQKVTRFVDLADTFHLPVVHLVDNPGFVIGVDAERAATIRHGARALAAIYQAQGAMVLGHPAQGVRGRRRRAPERGAAEVSVCVAVGRLGQPPARRRDRGRIQSAARSGRRPRRGTGRDRTKTRRGALPVPHRGGVHDRGDRRPARHAAVALRVRQSRRARAWRRSHRAWRAAMSTNRVPQVT
jgi:acetyl-CoA carboxylase carboxyltransferase component